MSTTSESHGGVSVTLRAALSAGALAGAATGVADGLVAGASTESRGLLDWVGCLAGAALVYGLVWSAVALALGLAMHAWLRRRDHADRRRRLFGWTLGLALFLDLYWWTRPWFFYGQPATDPRRLAVAVGLFALALALGVAAARAARGLSQRAWRVAALAVAAAWLAGAVYLLVARSRTDEVGRINERNRDLPNVLLVINDALRADVLGCYGNQRVKTPRVDRLAAEGVLFERAMVQAPFTGTSFGSYFTGKYPRRHGFVAMNSDQRMAPNVTLASHLKCAEFSSGAGKLEPDDYHCITFMTGALTQAMGLMQGFDSYYEAFEGHELVDRDDPWSVFRSELVLYIVKSKLKQRLDDAPAAAEAVRWLHDNGHKRFFAMVHTFATHTPYDPPAEFRELYCDPSYAGQVKAFRSDHRMAIEGGAKPSAADVEQIRNLYYGGASHDDRQLADVLAELERQGVLENTLVIVTADHGEELGDHGLWEHDHMYQTNLRVPLVLSWPRALPSGKRVGALVESIDVVPTVCDLLGLKMPHEDRPDAQGRNYGAIDGKSVLPLVRGETASTREFSFAENGVEMSVQDLGWKLIVPAPHEGSLEGATLEALASADPARPPKLFDLAGDPGETRNLYAERRGEAQRLLDALKAWDASMPIPRSEMIQSERERRELERRLGNLGYGNGVGPPVDPPEKKPK